MDSSFAGPWPLSLIVFCALSHLLFEFFNLTRATYVTKPLTMLLIMAYAWWGLGPWSDRYQLLLCIGLVFSLVGDVLLMLPKQQFLGGLASFLVAHIFYCCAFFIGDYSIEWLPIAAVVVASTAFFQLIRIGVGNMLVPVLFYIGAIGTMVVLATSRSGLPHARYAAAGAVLFAISDSLLAFRKFRKPFPHAQVAVMATYFAAQVLIALSIASQ